MICITDVFATPRYPDFIDVEWKVNNPAYNSKYIFDVYLSDSPEGGFVKQNKAPIINSTRFQVPFSLSFKNEFLYIKVEVRVGDKKASSKPSFFISKVDQHSYNIANTIIEQKDLARDKFVGIDCEVRKRKIIGEACPDCCDPVLGQQIKNRCTNCFDTKIVGGYSDPISTRIEIVEGIKEIRPTEIGTVDNSMATGFLVRPLVFKNDVIIEKYRNARWRVFNVNRIQYRTLIVDQQLELRQISTTDIEYEL